MFRFNLKKEVTIEIKFPSNSEERGVELTYAFIKGQEPVTRNDYFYFEEGQFRFKWNDELHTDFATLMGLLVGGVDALEKHINKCYQSGKVEPLTLKTNPKFLNEEDREYLSNAQLLEESDSEVLRSIWRWYYGEKILKEDLLGWTIREITREQYPSEEQSDIHFAKEVLQNHFRKEYSIFIQYKEGQVHFYMVYIPGQDQQNVFVYVDGGESFRNWVLCGR